MRPDRLLVGAVAYVGMTLLKSSAAVMRHVDIP